jgi:hypothetical protein
LLKLKAWHETERIVVGGGFRASRVGELVIGLARAGGSTAGQPAAVSNRHGGLRRGASSQPQAAERDTEVIRDYIRKQEEEDMRGTYSTSDVCRKRSGSEKPPATGKGQPAGQGATRE